jgi:AdoMet-dependent rRNA methyltransferase SPB1
MPPGSIIIGVDLLPIKAIRNVKTLVSDITSSECRKLVSNELQGWNADVVLCDGAPNVNNINQFNKRLYNLIFFFI